MVALRRYSWIVVLALLVAQWHGLARAADPAPEMPAAPSGPDTWYAAAIARSDTTVLMTHYWSKGSRLRAETVMSGRRLITIVDDSTYYIIDPTTAEAIAIERSPRSIAGDSRRQRPFADELGVLLRGGGEQVGEEEREGQKLDHYQRTDDAGRIQVWVAGKFDLPVHVERYVRARSHREQIDYTNWRRDLPIDDSFFEPPSGVEIERVGYEEYVRRSRSERLGPAPPFHAGLLHGEPEATN